MMFMQGSSMLRALVSLTLFLGIECLFPETDEAATRWSWQEPQAKVLPTGDLEWAPHRFELKTTGAIRYIDFDSGDDANSGLSKREPWKHHPWDPTATGQAKNCKGAHT